MKLFFQKSHRVYSINYRKGQTSVYRNSSAALQALQQAHKATDTCVPNLPEGSCWPAAQLDMTRHTMV